MPGIEAGIKDLDAPQGPMLEKPTRIRITQPGEYDLLRLFREGLEAETWAGIDMAEDMPASFMFYNGGQSIRTICPSCD